MATVTLGHISGFQLHIDDYGTLYCDCMNFKEGTVYEPCRHVFAAMKSKMDANAPLGIHLSVPIYEEPVDGVYLVLEVTTHHSERRGDMTPFYLGDKRVGWLDEGEGRQAMRWVLLEYLRAQYHEAPPCKSTNHHNYLLSPRERKNLDLDSSQKTVIAGIASVLATGTCWRCVNSTNDDLVPEL